MPTDQRQILIKAHQGHEASARALWDHHAPRLSLYAGSILREKADVDDAVQAAFCRMLQLPAARIREVREPGAFLARMVRSAALNILRSARREHRRIRMVAEHASESCGGVVGPDPELARALSLLPRRFREVIVLKHFAGLTFDALAEVLETNRNTVAGRHRAAMEQLRMLLADNENTPRSKGAPNPVDSARASNNGVSAVQSEVHHV